MVDRRVESGRVRYEQHLLQEDTRGIEEEAGPDRIVIALKLDDVLVARVLVVD